MGYAITDHQMEAFLEYLRGEDRSKNTISKYMRDVTKFRLWLDERDLTKENVAAWKECLSSKDIAPISVNSKLAAVNSFLICIGKEECKLRYVKVQRRMFREDSRELDLDEYKRLVLTAQRLGQTRLSLLIETICATGVRVSEVGYITVEAASAGMTNINMKGKIRTILIPTKLCRKLIKYAKKQNITSGQIFITAGGTPLSRRQIWGEMKRLCKAAGIDETKVFPHNLRHLFARTYYKNNKDIVRLADLLGHSSVETTRIYLLTTHEEHCKYLDKLGLVI